MEINGLDLKDIFVQVGRRKNRYLALLMHDLEAELGRDSREFQVVRKLVLDSMNDLVRSFFRVVFGEDVEGLNFK